MRLKKMRLENFRCFKQQEIDLSADVVAIYGRNGVGKTAIFDGLEWALLGGIGRYANEAEAPDYLACVFTEGDPTVQIEFDGGSGWVRISRARTPSSIPTLTCSKGHRTHRDFLYGAMLNAAYSAPRREVAVVKDFLRSAVLLSQDSIREFIEGDPERRAGVLSYIAGSATIQRCLARAKEVHGKAEARAKTEMRGMAEAKEVVAQLKARLAERKARIVEIRRELGTAPTVECVLGVLGEAGIELPVGISRALVEQTDEAVASVRGVCEERLADLGRRRDSLAEIEALAQQHPGRVTRRQELGVMVEQAKSRLDELLKSENDASARLTEVERAIPYADQESQRLASRAAALEEIPHVKRRVESLSQSLRDLQARRDQSDADLRHANAEAEKHLLASSQAKSEAASLEREVARLLERESLLRNLVAMLDSYEAARDAASAAQATIEQLPSDVARAEQQMEEIARQKSAQEEQVSRLSGDIGRQEAAVALFQQLLVRVGEFATGRGCPLCGQQYGSHEELQQAIHRQIDNVPSDLQVLARNLQEASSALSEVTVSLGRASEELRGLRARLQTEEQRQHAAMDEVRRFEQSAGNVGVPPSRNAVMECLASVRDSTEQQRQELSRTEQRIREHKAEEGRARQTASQVGANLGSLDEEIARIQSELSQAQSRVVELGVAEDLLKPESEVTEQVRRVREQLAEHDDRKRQLLASGAQARALWQTSREERTTVEGSLREWEDTLTGLGKEIGNFSMKCTSLGLEGEPSVDVLSALRERMEVEGERLQDALRVAEAYQRSCQAAALEQEQSAEHQQLNTAEENLSGMQSRLAALRAASKTSDNWAEVLTGAVGAAVKARLESHRGEIVRLFKAMIPCPHVFEDIHIARDTTGVHLGLRYKGMGEACGEPKFYLSSAQANILALAIFLSFSQRQGWCKLGTLMLDDPVQHLDDLDAVAFLDCLRSMTREKVGARKQVLITTCDKNLYLLIIRKFLPLIGAGLTLTGISLLDGGTNGPEVHYDIGGPSKVMLPAMAV